MKVFADTFFYLALLDSHDSAHDKAIAATKNLDEITVTTAWVLVELANALCSSPSKDIY